MCHHLNQLWIWQPAQVCLFGPFPSFLFSEAPVMFQGTGAYLAFSVPEEQSHSSCNVVSLSSQSLTQISSPFKHMQVCLPVSAELWNWGWQWENAHSGVQRHLPCKFCSSFEDDSGTPKHRVPHPRCMSSLCWCLHKFPSCEGNHPQPRDLENWAFMSMPATASAGDVTCSNVSAEIKAHSLSCQYGFNSHKLEIYL